MISQICLYTAVQLLSLCSTQRTIFIIIRSWHGRLLQKLLWAVSASLKQAGIGSSHKHFRLCGRKLYKICKNFWTSCPLNRNVKVGISEKMLSLATEHVNNVIKEIDDQNFSSNSLELYSQDSNSCDFFFKSNDSQNESWNGRTSSFWVFI